MGHYDIQQVCLNGHQITAHYHAYSEVRRKYCPECGAVTIHTCPHCGVGIKGAYDIDGVVSISGTPVPTFCESCGSPFPWSEKLKETALEMRKGEMADALTIVETICTRFHLVVKQLRSRHSGRTTLDVIDEYDVQDVLHSLLVLFFDDVRPEEYTPSYAGKSTRMDFLLKNESIVLEAKMTRRGLGMREVGEQLIVDVAHYQAHPGCQKLICFVYDPDGRISNPKGLENDLKQDNDEFSVRVIIVPKGY